MNDTRLLLSLALFATVACGGGQPDRLATAREEANALYGSVCSSCHGRQGRGNGPGASLALRPRSFADAGWQRSVTDEQIATVITRGGAAVGRNPAMPAHPQLQAKPEVLAELVDIVRGFGD